jgi:ribonuclease E
MATKRSGMTTEGKFSTVMQAEVMETQREVIDDWDTDEVLGISPENGEDVDEDDDDDDDSDIEELDDDSDDDDSDEG